ncbi:phage BR0599 family protein [Phytopseudomonas daroniae]|uniref:phage BR0599 family protein n=1 Tax=Phytopseudomonas daroniae TaxID=2487519 RepID=UPI0010384D8B|nr:phage BR0599 family protein [Pseudomonas daroniae]TBU75190.1 hypothetical protein DNK10_11070 [Pseudomonas daroniae]
MSFSEYERSLASGKPIRLYRFKRGVMRWLYNTGDRDLVIGSEVYRAVRGGIIDDGMNWSGNPDQDDLDITAPFDIEVAQLYRPFPPSAEVELEVFDIHYGDSQAVATWAGSIATVDWPKADRCTITCRSIEASMERPGLVDTYSLSCTAVLGDVKCRVDLNAYRVTTVLQSVTGASVSSGAFAAYPVGWFTGGYVEWAIGSGEFERRHIEGHNGSVLQLLGGIAGISAGMEVRVYPGCDFLSTTCNSKFDNAINFRGEPHLQGESPFNGANIW